MKSPTKVVLAVIILIGIGAASYFYFHSSKKGSVKRNREIVSVPQEFFKRFEGTVAGQPVVMYLTRTKGEILGSYFYSKVGELIELTNAYQYSLDHLPWDSLLFVEGDENSNEPTLALHFLSDSVLEGTWSTKVRTASITLHELYPDGSYKFDAFSDDDSTAVGHDSPHLTKISSATWVDLPSEDNPDIQKEFLLERCSYYLSIKSPLSISALQNAIKASDKDFVDSSLKSNFGIGINNAIDTSDIASFNNGDSSSDQDSLQSSYSEEDIPDLFLSRGLITVYDDNDIVVFDERNDAFTGSQEYVLDHTGYADFFHVLDMRARKELSLNDILSTDSASMQTLLSQSFQKKYGPLPKQAVKDVLSEEGISLSRNFYVTSKGICFVYNRGEFFRAMDSGIAKIFIPFTTLKGKLTPWFIKRMNL